MLSGKEKRALRAQGNQLQAEIWIGKEGISAGTLKTLDNSFNTKELVKIKLQESCPLDKTEAADILCRKGNADLVQIIGNTILLYRPFAEEKK
jgi:RNA-binding protein